MSKLKWHRYVGTDRASRPIYNRASPLGKELRILVERKKFLERTKQRGLAEKRKPCPDLVLLEKLRSDYRYYSRLVREAKARLPGSKHPGKSHSMGGAAALTDVV